ncbi:MAG: glycosyltransferase family 2 protein [Chloroflexi bacterium]|nr:glycosyltransferase family 2 protein [Chloroflexota bacterium]
MARVIHAAPGPAFWHSSPRTPLPPRSVRISAVLPAYNEEAVIGCTVRHVADALGKIADGFEVIVVDDGSIDGTGAVLARLAEDASIRLRIVQHERNRGYGAAVASGFGAASMDLIFLTDGDKQFDVREAASFIPRMDAETDLVIGWRRQRADPPIRRLNAWGWKLLINGLFGYTARDVDCAFKLFRREVWQSMEVQSRGATFSAELLVKARRLGFRIVELPVTHFPRTTGSATGAKPRVIIRAIRELLHLWLVLDRQLAEDRRQVDVRRRRMSVN